MQTCVFTPPHATGILVAPIVPHAGSHDMRLGRESSWPTAPSGTHFVRPLMVQRPFLRPDRESGVVVSWECENCRFHDLRHSAASYLAMHGASLLEIAEVLGHKTLAMVKR